MTRQFLPSTESHGSLPPLLRYYSLLRLLPAHPASLWSSLVSAVPSCILLFAPSQAECCPLGPGVISPGPRAGVSRWRPAALPGSWETLLCVCPALRLRPDLHASPFLGTSVLPPLILRRRPQLLLTFEARSHSFHTRCLRFAGRITPTPRKTRFRLVASLYRMGFEPIGSLCEVSAMSTR